VAFYAPAALNTVGDTMVFGAGPGAEDLHGSMMNTAVFEIIRNNF
jgi:hypothetical protein